MGEARQLPVGTLVGEYKITGLLGEGGMGVVYAGVHPVIGKDVAIKVLSPNLSHTPDLVARFVQEARAVNQIGHPNIIDIFAFGESPELGHYFVMPRLEGEDLRHRIERTGPMPLHEAVAVVGQICDALEAAHEKGIYHRDLKPDNVFLVPRRRGGDAVKILDFGIAKLTETGKMTVTRTGAPMGTPLFMSPEQWEGVGVDHRTDIYALGILFQFMITGRFPFESESQVALMRMHCDAAPTLPSAYGGPPAMDQPVAQALAKSADHRFPTSSSFLTAVQTAAGMSGGAVAGPPTGPITTHSAPSVVPGGKKRNALPWVLGAIVGVAGLIVAVVVLSGGEGEQTAANTPDASTTVVTPTKALDAAAAKPPPPKPDAQVAVEPKQVEIDISSSPRAEIFDADGKSLGRTPKRVKLPQSATKTFFTLKRRRYDDKKVEFTPNRDNTLAVELVRARKTAATGSGSGSGSGSDSTGTKSGSGSGSGSSKGTEWGTTTNPFGEKK